MIQVEQRKIGLIIGQNGKHIKELYRLTHCDIILPKRKKKEEDDWDDFNPQNYYYTYDAHNDTVKTNLNFDGNEGKNDKNDKNNDDEIDEDDPKRKVEIKLRGSPEEIRDAEVEINFMITKGRLMLDHERTGNKKRKHKSGDDNKDNDAEDAETAEDIRVPSKICGMLIGSGGQRVKELIEETGCEIWVDWDKDSHIEAGVSVVHLTGTRYSVDNAKEEIRRIQKLFEKNSTNFRFEIPAYCTKDLYGESGQNLKFLQSQYNVTINVKSYRNERSSIRIGNEDQRIQRTVMITLIGEYEDQIACKKGIDKLVGIFIKCQQCNNLKKEDDGYSDKYSESWFCNDCWDEFNGVEKDDANTNDQGQNQSHNLNQRMANLNINNNYNYNDNRGYRPQSQPQRPPQRPPQRASQPPQPRHQGYQQQGYQQGYQQQRPQQSQRFRLQEIGPQQQQQRQYRGYNNNDQQYGGGGYQRNDSYQGRRNKW